MSQRSIHGIDESECPHCQLNRDCPEFHLPPLTYHYRGFPRQTNPTPSPLLEPDQKDLFDKSLGPHKHLIDVVRRGQQFSFLKKFSHP